MAKTKISEFSSTSADNTDITNINIAEGCSPANVNNAIRSLMSLLKNQQDGSSGDPFTVAGTLVASGQAVSSGTLNVTGAFQLDGTAGASGQALVSAGGSNTPTWSALGTMAAQNSTAVAITGGTITGITDLAVADGGTGASTLSANAVLLGNGTSALQTVAPSTSGNVLTSNGTTWTSATPAGGIGIGQTWQDVTGSRAAGTTYTNSTGKPIFISVFGTGSPNSGVMSMTVDGVSLGQQGSAAVSSGVFYSTMTAIVPNGSTYRVNSVNNWSLGSWAELR
jgi:hypothetical protein